MDRMITLLLSVFCVTSALAAPAPREKFHLYLLAGQSNMSGRGVVEEQDRTPHPRVFSLNAKNEWVPATEPLHFDKKIAGVGPGLAFGKAMAEAEPDVVIGLIPCAVGGSPLSSWQPNAVDKATKTTPYDTAIERAKAAMKDGTLKGILWHQGESDCNEKSAPLYGNLLEKTLGRMRDDLGAPDACIVVGQLGAHIEAKSPWAKVVNQALENFPKRLAHCGFASSEGLKDKGDHTHFDSASQREFGKRFAAVMLKLQSQPAALRVKVWPDGLPDGTPLDQPEEEKIARVGHDSEPTLSVYLPPKDKATGAAVVICPGGGYSILAIEKEGDNVARWLNDLGVAGIVLKNRLKDYPQPSPILDAQQAIRLVRENAKTWGLDEHRIGIMGFSAGGHLAAATSNADPIPLDAESYKRYNAIDCRPDFTILVYGVVPQPGSKSAKGMYTPIQLSAKTPPTFLVHAKDDKVPPQLSIDYAETLKKLNVPVEIHLYDEGGHGYGLGQSGGPIASWPQACAAWLKTRGVLEGK
jgi:acetyl esterase/lipase